jgi:cyclase
MGDLFFNGRFPFIDVGSGGDLFGLTASIGKILEDLPADAKIIPGHGPLATKKDLENDHRMLSETTEHVRTQLAAGVALADVKQAGLPEEWKGWSWTFVDTERWIDRIAKSLEAAKTR